MIAPKKGGLFGMGRVTARVCMNCSHKAVCCHKDVALEIERLHGDKGQKPFTVKVTCEHYNKEETGCRPYDE